jgi:hypothetical protein
MRIKSNPSMICTTGLGNITSLSKITMMRVSMAKITIDDTINIRKMRRHRRFLNKAFINFASICPKSL